MLHNAHRWFLLGASLLMLGIAVIGILLAEDLHFPFAHGNRYIWLYRINYVILTWIILTFTNEKWVRVYGLLSGWAMIYLVLSNWFHLPPGELLGLTGPDNILHINLGLSSIFFALFFSEKKSGVHLEDESDDDFL
ncbi:MAG: hypothetical protein MUE33_11240 [Cytophagaceae bacterium]|jgi:hypothetical protein|nr:hypothetical protein [Cytophagaceae bacterium]